MNSWITYVFFFLLILQPAELFVKRRLKLLNCENVSLSSVLWRRSCEASRVWCCWYRRWHKVVSTALSGVLTTTLGSLGASIGGEGLGEEITKALNQRHHRGVSEYFSRWKKAELDIDPAVSRHQKKGKLNTKHESRLWRSDERVNRQRARRSVGRDMRAGQPWTLHRCR